MKKLLPLLLIVFLTNCGQNKEVNMQGAYSMLSQKMNNGSTDTAINRKQMKIYTKDHVIYAAMRLPDSLASFAIGTYDYRYGNVVERMFYSSANAYKVDSFTLKVEKSDSGYTQVIDDLPSQGKTVTLTEEYKNVGTADSTMLDGAWKLSNNFLISPKGDTTSNSELTEFKVYQSGNYIWASRYPDANKKLVTFFGYGKFTMNGNTRSKEVTTLSTYPNLINTPIDLEVELMGNDSYKQTILQPSGSKSIEIYERMKKE